MEPIVSTLTVGSGAFFIWMCLTLMIANLAHALGADVKDYKSMVRVWKYSGIATAVFGIIWYCVAKGTGI